MSLTQPIKWHGGKHYLGPWIIENMPPHLHYVEPYFGGGSVLLHKDPFDERHVVKKTNEGCSEMVNDIHIELTNFWRMLQHAPTFHQLRQLVEAIPMSRIEFESAGKKLDQLANCFTEGRIPGGVETTKRAAWFFIRARQSRQGLMKDFATPSRTRTRRGMNEQASSWLTAIEGLPEIHERLKAVVIENMDALRLIKREDTTDTLFYCDPPYYHGTRVTTNDYHHEMTKQDHIELLETLGQIKGKFLLSGYPSFLYTQYMQQFNWNVVGKEIDNKASAKKTKDKKTECLWKNF